MLLYYITKKVELIIVKVNKRVQRIAIIIL